MLRSSLLCLVALLIMGATPAAASSVALADHTATFSDADGVDDTVTLTQTSEGLRVYDNATKPLVPGAGCTQVSPHVVDCPGAAGFSADCGDGFDQVVNVDATTYLTQSCESVRTKDEETVTLPAQPLSIGTRWIGMRINCPDYAINDFGEYTECIGTAQLYRASKLIAAARFDIASGRGKRVSLKLTKLGRRLVGRSPLTVLVAVKFAAEMSAGEYPAVARWQIKLPAR